MFRNSKPLALLPERIEILVFSGNIVHELTETAFGTEAYFTKLEYIDLSSNHIEIIDGGAFSRTPRVSTLILSHNNIHLMNSGQSLRIFQGLTQLTSLYLTDAFMDSDDSQWHMDNLGIIFNVSNLDNLQRLHLEQNEIRHMTDENIFCRLPQLERLYLGSNRLNSIEFNIDCLENLVYIDLQRNSIYRLDEDTTDRFDIAAKDGRKHFSLNFYGNPFVCDCRLRRFIRWLNTTSVDLAHRLEYRCFDGNPTENVHALLGDVTNLSCPIIPPHYKERMDAPSYRKLMVLCAIVSFLCTLLVAFLIYKRNKLCPNEGSLLHPQLREAIEYVRQSRQYTNIDSEEGTVKVHV